ncbi:RagB/SusD family nutrient uptake outer membrane protein, partial [uncultured Bacteroides sp.]
MKLLSKIFALTLVMIWSVSCDFLDVVPDERTTDTDTYAGRNNGIEYLYSCYAYLPNPANTPGGLDLLTGDEVITAFEHETFAAFPKGNYSASSPVISYWNTFFQGIRQCYMFMERIDKFPDTSDAEKNDYRAQAKFLVAYYHFLLSRAYGPILLIKETPSTDILASEYPTRVPYDECVAWICNQLDEAAQGLPTKRDIKSQYGLATSIMAKSVKAKMLLYAASPLFNGNSVYTDFKDKEGVALMPASYDAQKWVKARDALAEAIKLAEDNGHILYKNDAYRGEDGSANNFPEK